MPELLSEGWGVLELAQERARQALAQWDAGTGQNPDRDVAEVLRRLLAELDADRRRRHA